ncbi:adenylate/guanylate cyclase domain-containing protein [Jhaorihella thermophila]|uniref:adenylate/guanylate cyclase domain-containing protein n=1 Tax=Jhaorihella thermophila TaxID=488547 RepID=UPI00360DE791
MDKYLGDGLLAVFETEGTAGSARAALHAATGIGTALEQFNHDLAAERAPPVRIGMGLHLGTLVLGEIGAAGAAPRTIIGDTVNIASRLEAKTKELDATALVSRELLEAAGVDCHALDLVTVELRGVAGPVQALPVRSLPSLAALPGLPD